MNHALVIRPLTRLAWLNILLVDDEPQVLNTLREMLRDMGVTQVFTARDGREALTFLGETDDPVHIVIADWNMPRMTGLELLTQVRTVDPDIVFLLLTGRADRASVEAAKEQKVTAYLRKPFSADNLRNKLVILSKHVEHNQKRAV